MDQSPICERSAEKDAVRLKVVLEPSEDGGFAVYVPALPGCIGEGDTADEAMANIREAIELHPEPTEDDGGFLPRSQVLEIMF